MAEQQDEWDMSLKQQIYQQAVTQNLTSQFLHFSVNENSSKIIKSIKFHYRSKVWDR